MLAEVLNKWLPKCESEQQSILISQDQRSPVSIAVPYCRIFDKDALIERMSGDEALVSVVIAVFLDEIPAQIEAIKKHCAAGDVDGVRSEAHGIKGASANVGGDRLTAAAYALEQAAVAGDMTTVRPLVPDLEAQFEALKEALTKLKK
jgi:HPt (histidine-containing phosphotransfer) domain-containing protein